MLRRNKIHQEEILKIVTQCQDVMPVATQYAILQGQVILGMSPYDAFLAAGEFTFKVMPDKAVWSDASDPYQVMWAQTMNPDDSHIWMTFGNDVVGRGQGAENKQHPFTVEVVRGKIVAIRNEEKRDVAKSTLSVFRENEGII